ncbi:MAG TPA: zinc-binding dehydrogenase, partial [Verrucomicrobiae bacterium]|nr:zinc-binding dehydrogenase [Verrucomicrobiae bacterium]
EFVRTLGADEVIDYRASRFEEVVKDVDVVFDAVGGETLDRSWGVLRPGGKLVTVATQGETAVEPRVKEAFLLVEANAGQLSEIAKLIDTGALKAFVAGTYPLAEARAAYAAARKGGLRGKIALQVGESWNGSPNIAATPGQLLFRGRP